jgi:hypothetical protein
MKNGLELQISSDCQDIFYSKVRLKKNDKGNTKHASVSDSTPYQTSQPVTICSMADSPFSRVEPVPISSLVDLLPLIILAK